MSLSKYDPTTPIGQVRLHAADTDIDNALFEDEEIGYFLTLAKNNPLLAASYALEAAAADSAKLAQMVKIGPITIDARTLAQTLSDRAANLRELASGGLTLQEALGGSSYCSPDQIFSTDSCHGATAGTMSGW